MKESISVAVVGDIMPSGVLYGSEKDAIHPDIVKELKDTDIRIGNLECALGPYSDAPHFDPGKMSRLKDIVWAIDEDLDRVLKMGFNVLCLANNHIYDLDKDGLKYTIDQLERKGLKYCGAGMNIKEASKPAVVQVKGKTIAVLSFCDYRDETVGYVPFATDTKPGVNPLYPMDYSCAEVKKYKALYDYVIVVPHWGVEHTWVATNTVINDAKKLVKAGADAVVGGHPHRIQSSYYYNGIPVFPSLGNFFFPDRWLNKPRPTWYPPKGTDTSQYPRIAGYPWVEEPTVKVWAPYSRIGMIAKLSITNHSIKKSCVYVRMTQENYLEKVQLSEALPKQTRIQLSLLRFLYKNWCLYNCIHSIKQFIRRFMSYIKNLTLSILKESPLLRSCAVSIAALLRPSSYRDNTQFAKWFREYYPFYQNIKVKDIYKDYLSCKIMYSIPVKDYFAYDWVNKSSIARNDYITDRRNDEWYIKCDDASLCPIMANKVKFNNYYKDFIKRDWLFIESSDLKEEFISFCQKHNRIVIKPTDGQRGDQVRVVDVSTVDLINSTWDNCKDSKCLIEEVLVQGDLARFHPQSVNTVRISTAIDKEGIPHIMASSIRFGRGDNFVDNAHAGGLFCGIDVESGMIISPGIDKTNTHHLYHPDTHQPFLGYVIPQWKELKEIALKAASILPGLRYIGWDWVLCSDGKWELLEGNEPGNPDVLQLGLGRGLYSKYKAILE